MNLKENIKHRLRSKLNEMTTSGESTPSSETSEPIPDPNRLKPLSFKRPEKQKWYEPGDVQNPDPTDKRWPSSAPTYQGPNGEQVWVIPGPPPNIWIFVPNNSGDGGPGYYFNLQREKVGGAGLNAYYRWQFTRWNHLMNVWENRDSGDYIHDILQNLPGFEEWQDPTAPPGPGWQTVPVDGTLDIPGDEPWMSNPWRNQ